MRKDLVALFSIAALVALAAFVVFAAQYAQPEAPRTTTGTTTTMATSIGGTRTTTTMATNIGGLPPFANPDFDVLLRPPIVTIPESGGSVSVFITLKATKLNTSELLVLKTDSKIPGYAADFKPTSVTLHPGDLTSIELTVFIPSGIQKGTYPMSIVAIGETTQGGSWLIIVVGLAQPIPPP